MKRNAVGRLLAYIALLDLRRLAICFSSAIRSSIRIVTMRSLLYKLPFIMRSSSVRNYWNNFVLENKCIGEAVAR